ncbi:two-component system sensor histidine kinase YesM [Bacillus sp. SORGH_AS 510]|uniref:cache domain-containing sensor histidine kinase n=1 Tax=Bacillus sp. SORGH_AS_0510 TaxID=3041771 RepID=UPI00278B9C6D|nr:sensor histidine kinase [Bacillus sp. SORGH_AS_0510]MDQ1147875.1 two-component system sensor histidine kinase YesM [Bacillus sp. SORGH_AS_0510]
MWLIPNRFKHNNLFITMFFIALLMIVIVSVTITWTTIRMSEQFFFEKFSITNSKVMNQVKESFESFNYSIIIASNNLLQSGNLKKILTEEGSNTEKMNAIFTMSQQMKHIKSNLDAYEVEIIVTGNNGLSYATDRNYWPITDEELENSALTRNTFKSPKRLLYQYDHRPAQTSEAGDGNVIVASKALMDRLSGRIYGSMYFAIQEKDFRKFYSSYTTPGNNVVMADRQGVIVSSNLSKLIGKKDEKLVTYAAKIEKGSNEYIIEKFMGKDQIITMEYLPSFDMFLFNIIDKQRAVGDLINKKAIVLISMGIVFAALIIVFLASRRVTNSLSRLVKQIGNAPKHNFHQYVAVTGTYETRQIGNAFNSMLDELHDYVEKLVLAQKQQRNAELAALQQQINPHFLYNTLTSIKFMVQQGVKEETESVINALISLLQNTIGNVSETITVEQEVENLKNYVLINQKRYGDRIKVNYFVSPDCREYQIPKLILQPFIENSFFHGFNKKANGYINVLVWQEGDSLVCEVVDNGDGMEVSAENKLPSTKRNQQLFSGIGVRNVHERIQLIYGEAFGVTISSDPGEGTKVRITLPCVAK